MHRLKKRATIIFQIVYAFASNILRSVKLPSSKLTKNAIPTLQIGHAPKHQQQIRFHQLHHSNKTLQLLQEDAQPSSSQEFNSDIMLLVQNKEKFMDS